jgi:hypothetical protein
LSNRHPLTGEPCSVCDIRALELPWTDGHHTESVLDEMWSKFRETQEFKKEVKEMEEQLLQIDRALSHINKSLREVTGEKVQIH